MEIKAEGDRGGVFWKLINKIKKEGKLPEDWKRGVLSAQFQKRKEK